MAKAHLLLALALLSGGAAIARPPTGQTPKPPATIDFVTAAQQSDQYEMLSSRIALIASQNPAVRGFAQQMIGDHAGTSQSLRQAATRSGLTPPPPGLGADQSRLLSALQSLTGPDFDKTYAKQQVLAHQQALVVEQGYATNGSDANVRQAASAAVPIIQQHLQMARQMAATIGGS